MVQVATAQMTDHRFLTPDRNVQQASFSNCLVATVNFGAGAYTMPGGETVGPMQFHVSGSN